MASGANFRIGTDEVGYGAIAGPLYVVGVAQPINWKFPGVKDSKKFGSDAKARDSREQLFYSFIDELKGSWALAIRTAEEIDERGVYPCLIDAHTTVIRQLLQKYPQADIIVDGTLKLPALSKALSVPKADELFPLVSAASIIAKVLRDGEMVAQAERYKNYGFESNMGYGTPKHYKALDALGPCAIHRRSYLKGSLCGS